MANDNWDASPSCRLRDGQVDFRERLDILPENRPLESIIQGTTGRNLDVHQYKTERAWDMA